MVTNSRRVLALSILVVAPLLAACPGDFEGGYEIVPHRERTPLAMPSAPEPPPFVPGLVGGATAETPTLASAPAGVTQEMVEEGQQLYGTVCTACHGPGGAGSVAGPGLQDQDWIHISGDYESIVSIIQAGVPVPVEYLGMMPPLGGGNFDEAQVRAIAAYVLALSQQG